MIYIAFRYGERIERRYDTLQEAIESAAGDHDSGEAAMYQIRSDAGDLVLNSAELLQAVSSVCQEWDRLSDTLAFVVDHTKPCSNE